MSDQNKQIDDGGPAFPSHGTMGEVAQEGMTLRDYFAAKAMQGLLSNPNVKPEVNALTFYRWADYMLAARKDRT